MSVTVAISLHCSAFLLTIRFKKMPLDVKVLGLAFLCIKIQQQEGQLMVILKVNLTGMVIWAITINNVPRANLQHLWSVIP